MQVRAARLGDATVCTVAATLQTLGTPSRFLILTRLRHGPLSVTELTAAVGTEQSAVSHQFAAVRPQPLHRRRAGRSIVYRLYDNHVAQLLDEAFTASSTCASPCAMTRMPLPAVDRNEAGAW